MSGGHALQPEIAVAGGIAISTLLQESMESLSALCFDPGLDEMDSMLEEDAA